MTPSGAVGMKVPAGSVLPIDAGCLVTILVLLPGTSGQRLGPALRRSPYRVSHTELSADAMKVCASIFGSRLEPLSWQLATAAQALVKLSEESEKPGRRRPRFRTWPFCNWAAQPS